MTSVLSFPSQWLDLLERGVWWNEIQCQPLFQSDIGAFSEKYLFQYTYVAVVKSDAISEKNLL